MNRYEHAGLSFAYERAGEGPPLLFLIGSGATVASMQILVDLLASRPDRPGCRRPTDLSPAVSIENVKPEGLGGRPS